MAGAASGAASRAASAASTWPIGRASMRGGGPLRRKRPAGLVYVVGLQSARGRYTRGVTADALPGPGGRQRTP